MKKEDKIYNKKRTERNNRQKKCYPQITNKFFRIILELICLLKIKEFKSLFIYLYFTILAVLLILLVIYFPKISFYPNKIEKNIMKEKKNILIATLATPNQKKWLEQIDEFQIIIPNKICKTFRLNKNNFKIEKNILDTKTGFHNIKFKSNKYTLKYSKLQKEKMLLNGLDKVINEMYEIYNIDYLWFFARSFADSSDLPNKKYPLNKRYLYNEIKYYKLLRPKDSNMFYFINKYNLYDVKLEDNRFSNNDLIYLRSKFVLEEILKGFIDTVYIKVEHKQFGILEGEVLDEKNEEYRKTDIYISFCNDI